MTSQDVATYIEKDGYALIRNAIPKARVLRYRGALDAIYAETKSNGDVAPEDFQRSSGLSMAELFDMPVLKSAARGVLGASYDGPSVFMSVALKDLNSTAGLGLHTDGIIQGTERLVLTMWAPLHECGKDAPGIAIVPGGKSSVLRYLRGKFPGRTIPGWCSTTEWNDTGAFDESEIRRNFGEPLLPIMSPGDVVLFTNWTIHGSNVKPGMTKRRSAAIYRLNRKTLLQSIWHHELELFGRRRSLKGWVRGDVA